MELILTRGERLLIQRKRVGLSQKDTAALYGAALQRYKEWENDKRDDAPEVPVGELEGRELCYLHRRRRGWSIDGLALMMNMPRDYVHRAERGKMDSGALVGWWRKWLTD